jgi:hypothetical protein
MNAKKLAPLTPRELLRRRLGIIFIVIAFLIRCASGVLFLPHPILGAGSQIAHFAVECMVFGFASWALFAKGRKQGEGFKALLICGVALVISAASSFVWYALGLG